MYRVMTVLYTEAIRLPTIPIKKINARLTDLLHITHIKRQLQSYYNVQN